MKKILFVAFLFLSQISIAQKPCDTNPKYNEFNFWISEWEVYDLKNNVAGYSKISKILDNCVVLEEWTSTAAQKGFHKTMAANLG